MGNVTIYTTAYVYEIDMIREYFKKQKIPYFVQVESLGGVKGAFPVNPTSGFGIRYHLIVPEKIAEFAREQLAALPLSKDSDQTPFPFIEPKVLRSALLKLSIIFLPIIILFGWILYTKANQ